jgi:hypothetical protein
VSGDIVERLRDVAAEIKLRHLESQIGHPGPLHEAADEIERLRAALRLWASDDELAELGISRKDGDA